MDDVVPVEKVRYSGGPICRRRLREIHRECEVESWTAVRLTSRIDHVVIVGVGVGRDIVALGQLRFGADLPVGVMPAERRSKRV